MADTLALSKLYGDVQELFSDWGMSTVFGFGTREPTKQTNQATGRANRIVFVRGDKAGGVGKIDSPRNPGRNPKPLATLVESFHVYIWGWDASAPEDELKQYEATRFLYDLWYRAMYHAARGTFAVLASEWQTPKSERRFGDEIIATCTIESVIPDSAWPMPDQPVISDITNRIALPSGDEICCEGS